MIIAGTYHTIHATMQGDRWRVWCLRQVVVDLRPKVHGFGRSEHQKIIKYVANLVISD